MLSRRGFIVSGAAVGGGLILDSVTPRYRRKVQGFEARLKLLKDGDLTRALEADLEMAG